MSITERKEREKEELKNKILNAAAEIVTESGHINLKIRALAEKIEYSPRTIYLYFPDKAALLEAVIEKGFKYTIEKMKKMDFSVSVSPEENMHYMIENHIKMAFSNPNYYRAVVTMTMNKDFQPGVYQTKVIKNVEKIISLYKGNSSASHDEIEIITGIVMNNLRGFTLNLINGRKMEQADIDKQLKIFMKILFDGLKEY